MFRKAHRKLSAICCLTMAWIVLAIVLCCLHVSEKNMYGQEKALFFLQANTISSDLYASKNISMEWYKRNIGNEANTLSIETDGIPSTLTSLALSPEQQSLIQEIKKASPNAQKLPNTRMVSAKIKQEFFEYSNGAEDYLVMNARFFEKEHKIDAAFLYSLAPFRQNVRLQRMLFLFIWLASLLALYLFSHLFTSRVLQPLIQNDEKQKRFIAFASHELRSPLAVFKTGLSILTQQNPSLAGSDKTARIFTLMDTEMSRMERLIQDLLCLAKAEQAALHFQFQPANLADLLQSAYEKHAPIAAEKQISLTLIPICSQGQPKQEPICLCDPQRIEQAVAILLDNALSYTPAGQKVTLRLLRQRGKCCIQVIDTGIGIPDREKEKIFDKFYRMDSSRSQKEHYGLGLSIAKEICHAHNGRIWASDTPGGGSTFTIRLPLRPTML